MNNSVCEGARYVWEMFNNNTQKYYSIRGDDLLPNDFVNPCGFIAKSYFTGKGLYVLRLNFYINLDKYEIVRKDTGKKIAINETNIANNYDREKVFKRHPNYTKLQWVDVENGII